MKCSVFIATSIDGYIANENDAVDWLYDAGDTSVDMGDQADMGFNKYMASVDCMIMGRISMQALSAFNLTEEQWPYSGKRIIVLSNTLNSAPDNLKDKVEMYSGDIQALLSTLENEGHKHAYIDGGVIITNFLNEQLINEITITTAPLLLGQGKALFGYLSKTIKLDNTQVHAYPNGFTQSTYQVRYD